MKKRSIAIAGGLLVLATLLPVAGYYYQFGRPHPADPAAAIIRFEDLARFAVVHRESPGDATAYQREYFDLGGRAVDLWGSQFDVAASGVAEHVAERPALYDDLEARVSALSATEPAIRQAYAELERRYPDAVFSPLHVFFGGYSTRSLIRPFGILFAGEYFLGVPAAMDPESPLYVRGLMAEPDGIVRQVIHEQAHIQQARRSPLAMFTGSVLERSIYEGTADYVAELITGAHNNSVAHRYVERHGEALWCEFHRSIDLGYRTHWIDAERYGRPPAGIIGVFGHEIARAYYETFESPLEGLEALLELTHDYDEIYRRSGLRDRLAAECSRAG